VTKDYKQIHEEIFSQWQEQVEAHPQPTVRNYTLSEGNYVFEIYETMGISDGVSVKTSRLTFDKLKFALFLTSEMVKIVSWESFSKLGDPSVGITVALVIALILHEKPPTK
jgi:hypothetical protein